tara:strand:- start:135 stop:455 length:321 start_codon:yes stop_codon:yes gene_type:complete
MESWIVVAEKFGVPLVLLLGAVWGIVKLFNWMANDMMQQIKLNEQRIENIVIKLIDSNKKQMATSIEERVISNQQHEAILNQLTALTDVFVKVLDSMIDKMRSNGR